MLNVIYTTHLFCCRFKYFPLTIKDILSYFGNLKNPKYQDISNVTGPLQKDVVHTDPHWMVRTIAGQIQLRDSRLD